MTGSACRAQIKVEGTVQGVGFRPFVLRVAQRLELTGWIRNGADGVVIEVEGEAGAIDQMLERLRTTGSAGMRIDRLSVRSIPSQGDSEFTILASSEDGVKHLAVSPDLATCANCVAELFDPADRRFRYPWLSCTQCGPRFSMLTGVPYDRANTTMAGFTLCKACRAEYEAPADRRYHAESTACVRCGPGLALWKAQGEPLGYAESALRMACDIVRDGGIVAIKGLGGFHLWADATSVTAVRRLRERKQRPHKPLAVMFPSLSSVKSHCRLSSEETAWLTSPEAPIVILQRLGMTSLVPEVAPGNMTVGSMLPYTPLHHLLMHELAMPVVATSGNRSDEPIVTDEQDALKRLDGMADAFLFHDRPIARPMDDSIVRVAKSGTIVVRRARGLVPRTIRLPAPVAAFMEGPVLAVGGHLKNTVALLDGDRIVLSQHLGDFSTLETERAVHQAIDDLQWLLGVTPRAIACDLHPDYRSTHLAEKLAGRYGIPLIRVQHHHAHVAACMAEQGVSGEVMGVAWDGTGYGADGSLWGGECLLSTYHGYRRVAHLHPFRLPGGEQAVREPRRTALALEWEAFGAQKCPSVIEMASDWSEQSRLLVAMLERQIQSPVTTSIGRLFDGVASMLGLCQIATFEGQAAMALEQEGARAVEHAEDEAYPIPLLPQENEMPRWIADWRPMIALMAEDLRRGNNRPRIAYRFHRSLAELIGQLAERIGVQQVVLTGGCFQNALLVDLARARLESAGFLVLTHRAVPPNDGGLALGQAVIAATQLGRMHHTSFST